MLEKRQQLLSVQQSLDQQKAEDEYKEGQFRRREENLRKKDLELQEALVLFNKFLKDNEIKRRRAEQRANEEIKKRLHWVSAHADCRYRDAQRCSHPLPLHSRPRVHHPSLSGGVLCDE